MIDWLKELEELPSVPAKTKTVKHTTDRTDKTSNKEVENALEAAEERAAIMEHDGGLSRADAEKHAIETHLKPFLFTTTDGGGTFLGSGTLDDAIAALEYRFRRKLVSFEQHHED